VERGKGSGKKGVNVTIGKMKGLCPKSTPKEEKAAQLEKGGKNSEYLRKGQEENIDFRLGGLSERKKNPKFGDKCHLGVAVQYQRRDPSYAGKKGQGCQTG